MNCVKALAVTVNADIAYTCTDTYKISKAAASTQNHVAKMHIDLLLQMKRPRRASCVSLTKRWPGEMLLTFNNCSTRVNI